MPKLIKDGQVVDDEWQGQLLSLAELNESSDLEGTLGLVLEADQPPSAIETELSRLDLIAINFPVFTDGRGFSTAVNCASWALAEKFVPPATSSAISCITWYVAASMPLNSLTRIS